MASADVATSFNEAQIAALANPNLDPLLPNSAAWRAAELPSANGFGSARGLARLYGALGSGGTLDGKRILGADAIAQATALRIDAPVMVMGIEARWAAGFLRNVHGIYGPSEAAFGHSGWGGSFAFADPGRRLAIAYVMNRLGQQLIGDPRTMALIGAAYAGVTR